ncbi:MotA/TolQ/ExbB proton channel family protein [Puniceicoccales bacterium CK1056]|uniref:MotA/TolQ/ExbB proton channel family protein n=1 Tax=Oceanipulchritudo coccoides TaxID=2706888 RepID=A0A6B2M1Q2_9BACT|nr:MotA/TolQ/ExbB proton channel family protein [Oceanipulchritudo coccoides]NDV62139.1 MotA/TolQ/ExbB proton channel family protein [Oceanipulchritudo coccoides]
MNNSIWEQFQAEFMTILTDGGSLMVPLTLLALTIYYTAFKLFYFFSEHHFYKVNRDRLIGLVEKPSIAKDELRQVLDYTQNDEVSSVDEVRARFAEIFSSYLSEIDSKRAFLLILITTAPLMGLLGTVMGMLTTFSGLAISSGGSTVDQIAAGISEALITTQTGLIIAIPAYVMATLIQKRRNEMEACLTTMEALTIQLYEKKLNLNEESA